MCGRTSSAILAALAWVVIASSGPADAADTAGVRPTMLDRTASITSRAASQLLLAAAFAGKRIVAVGQSGHIVYSDDDGNSWHPASQVPTSATLTGVAFASEREGWAIGHLGVILRTADGGITWERQLDGAQASRLVLASVQQQASRDHLEARQQAIRSAESLVKDGPNKPFLALTVHSRNRVEVFGAFGLAFASVDGGKTWQPSQDRYENPRGLHFYGAAEVGADRVLVGEQGLVLHTNNDGPFKRVSVPYEGTMFGVLATPAKTLVAYGLRGNVLLSRDAGARWTKIESGAVASLQAGTVLPDGTVVLGSESGQLIASRNDGGSFFTLKTGAQPAASILPIKQRAILVFGPRGAQHVDLSAEQELK